MYRTPGTRPEYRPRPHMPDCACGRCVLRRSRANIVAWALFAAVAATLLLAAIGAGAVFYVVLR